jgi:hypothetical protein
MILVAGFVGRDELPLARVLLQRVFPQQYSDEQAAVASLWRALVVRRLEVAELATTEAWRSRELVPTEEHPERFRGRQVAL